MDDHNSFFHELKWKKNLLLMGFLAVGAVRTFTAVIRLDGEAVLLLAFTVQRLL